VRKIEGSRDLFQTVSVATSTDGIHFEKYEGNPVIDHYPPDGSLDFRDPAVCRIGDAYYCVVASGNPEAREARLLLYKSEDLLSWRYLGIMSAWAEGKYAECPSFLPMENGAMLAVSVCPLEARHYFSILYGQFSDEKFIVEAVSTVDKGPDQYAGQVFSDPRGRLILLSWIPGWSYSGYAERDVGCMSIPRELRWVDGRIVGYPIEELQHLLVEEDPSVIRTETGFVIPRQGRDPVIYEGEIRDLKILRDGYLVEVFVNGGEEVWSALL
jgi:beta-fructofuranosidase